ncbi:MAG TPA: uroporphyrinogen decarboxylase family protein, partial [Thermoleophilia bacterium]|nr:uroporphyrinogen decarboxylase family protein [Thermoleophilia bacterium]
AAGYEAIGSTQMRWPGGDLPDDTGFQFVEDEYMRPDEYDEFLADPNGFTLAKIFPRIASGLEGFGQVPIPPLYWMANTYYLMNVGGALLAAPPVRKALESLLAMSDAVAGYFAADAANAQEMAALGYPRTWGAPIIPAFDVVSDMFRSLRGSTLDMYRHPEQLLATIDLVQEAQVGLARMVMAVTGNPRVFIPMHRGAGGFMSDEQFEKFYWPTFKGLVLAIIEAGGVPNPLFEGDYTPRLKYLAEFPPGKVAGHFDRIDRAKFKEVLGDSMCFWGNVPVSLLCTGTPQQVKDDVKELIDLFGDGGALMLDSGLGVPDEARPENMHALREAADEYGVF